MTNHASTRATPLYRRVVNVTLDEDSCLGLHD
jgi:hypothetical protein